VRAFFVEWAKKNKGKAGFDALSSCMGSLSEHDGEVLLRHVTKGCKSDEEFKKAWTKNPTHVLGTSLYIQLRKWLGAGKSDLS
jgi:hypothetical protein